MNRWELINIEGHRLRAPYVQVVAKSEPKQRGAPDSILVYASIIDA